MSTAHVVGALAVMAIVVVAAVLGLRGGQLQRAQKVRLTCPRLVQPVDCTIVQDVRNGQWKQVVSCSAFAYPPAVNCDQQCRQAMNLGFTLSVPVEAAPPSN